nr:cation-transporting P-type ATPase [Tanacetum cinerariifolium]
AAGGRSCLGEAFTPMQPWWSFRLDVHFILGPRSLCACCLYCSGDDNALPFCGALFTQPRLLARQPWQILGHEGYVCALLGQHNNESIITFPVDGFIQKANGFAGVFPDKSCTALAYLPLLII